MRISSTSSAQHAAPGMPPLTARARDASISGSTGGMRGFCADTEQHAASALCKMAAADMCTTASWLLASDMLEILLEAHLSETSLRPAHSCAQVAKWCSGRVVTQHVRAKNKLSHLLAILLASVAGVCTGPRSQHDAGFCKYEATVHFSI